MPNKSDKIYIQKTEFKKMDAVRINSEEDIPENLRGAITVSDGQLKLECKEGAESVPFGRVIRWEATEVSENCPHGINLWTITPEDEKTRLVEKDGVFYQKPTPTEAAPIDGYIPDFVKGANIKSHKKGEYRMRTEWGESNGKTGDAYWVKYGTNPDGTPNANILTKSEKSFDAYSVCTSDGKNLGTLRAFDDKLMEMRKTNPNVTYADVIKEAFTEANTKAEQSRNEVEAVCSKVIGCDAKDSKAYVDYTKSVDDIVKSRKDERRRKMIESQIELIGQNSLSENIDYNFV